MYKTVPIVLIALAATASLVSAGSLESSPLSSLLRRNRADFECTTQGLTCKSCTEVVSCEYEPDGTLLPLEGDKCTGKQTCMDGKCTEAYNEKCHPTVELFEFKCQQEGIFPDPFNCTIFQMCAAKDEEPVMVQCPTGLAFDPRTLMCSLRIPAGKECTRAVKPCQNLGQGPIAGNPRLYYLCRKDTVLEPEGTLYFPTVLHCAADLLYVDGRCMDPTKDQNVVNAKCSTNGYFFSSKGCNLYNECKVNVAPVTKLCPTGQYFNRDTKLCTLYSCSVFP